MIYAFTQAFGALYAYIILAGIVEGVLYSRKGSDAFKWNEHVLYIALIVCVCSLYLLDSGISNIWDKVMVILVVWFSYPLVHDAAYFETRRRIDVPEYRWYSFSTNRSNRIEIPSMIRVCLFVWAWLLFAAYLILKYKYV